MTNCSSSGFSGSDGSNNLMNLWVIERAASQDICCPLSSSSYGVNARKQTIHNFLQNRCDKCTKYINELNILIRNSGNHTERDAIVRAVQMACIPFVGTGLQTDGRPWWDAFWLLENQKSRRLAQLEVWCLKLIEVVVEHQMQLLALQLSQYSLLILYLPCASQGLKKWAPSWSRASQLHWLRKNCEWFSSDKGPIFLRNNVQGWTTN